MRTHYEVLGVPREATAEQIKAAYRRQAARLHPDKPGGSAAAFQALQGAYAVLSDPAARDRYDLGLELEPARQAGARLREHAVQEIESIGGDLVRAGGRALRRLLGVGR